MSRHSLGGSDLDRDERERAEIRHIENNFGDEFQSEEWIAQVEKRSLGERAFAWFCLFVLFGLPAVLVYWRS